MNGLTKLTAIAFSALAFGACSATGAMNFAGSSAAPMEAVATERDAAAFEADRQAILSMLGEYAVTFDFIETVAIAPGYELAEQKVTPAREIVLLIEDSGDFISLQHLLMVGPEEEPIVIKHWRQDWAYEPSRLMAYRGFNRWEMLDITAEDAAGAWSQTVYQVDDSPRYAALAAWAHAPNASTWEPPVSWRPLPRRDGTTRDDYDVIAAVNRHTVTDWGWTHEQDNQKVVLRDELAHEVVREFGLNTYRRADLQRDDAVHAYWESTGAFWGEVREAWDAIMASNDSFHVDDDAEGTRLYGPVLSEGQAIFFEAKTTEEAWAEAAALIDQQVTAGVEITLPNGVAAVQ
ncbi:MAG: DUF6607 family protein [Pseudomonadota bacterium]